MATTQHLAQVGHRALREGAAAMRARAATMSATGRSPIVQCAAKPGTGTVTSLADMVSVAASNTKSYSLDLPAATIAKPSVSAQVTRPISRLGWSPSTGVTTRPRARAWRASPGPTTLSTSLETSTRCRPASTAMRAWRAPASGWPVASTTTSTGSSMTAARSDAATARPASQAAFASAPSGTPRSRADRSPRLARLRQPSPHRRPPPRAPACAAPCAPGPGSCGRSCRSRRGRSRPELRAGRSSDDNSWADALPADLVCRICHLFLLKTYAISLE